MRKRIVRVISLTLLGMFAVISVITRLIILDSYLDLERSYMEKDVARFLSAMDDEAQGLAATVKDWSEWDEMYAFVKERSLQFIEQNLADEDTYTNFKANLILIIDSSSRVVYQRAVDLATGKDLPFPSDLVSYLTAHQTLSPKRNSGVSGIALLAKGPLLFASHSIFDTQARMPPRGTLVMGRYLDAMEIDRLSRMTRLSVSIANLSSPGTPSDFRDAAAQISGEGAVLVKPLDAATVAGYARIVEAGGDKGLMVRVKAPRDIERQGVRGVAYVILSLAFIGIVNGVVVMLFLEKEFISRVHSLSAAVLTVGTSNAMSMRVSLSGTDEIAYLGAAINGMLDALERSTDELRRSEARNEALLAAVPDMIFRLAGDGTLIDFRWPARAPFRPLPKGVIGINLKNIPSVYPFIPPRIVERMLSAVSESAATGAPQVFEFQSMDEGTEHSFEARVVASGENESVIFIQEITAEKEAKEAQRKEILLKEIHHRVKNNLQVISSLLDLQARASNDARTIGLLRESQSRLRSMSLIHEKLYQAGDTMGISMDEYVSDLAIHLHNSFGAGSSSVKVEVDTRQIVLDMDVAVPCGLVINELASNALKYAFPEGRKGTVRIGLSWAEPEDIVLTVSDDGVGMPEGLDIRSPSTLGLRIVNILASQLRGKLELDRTGGTRFTLTFSKPGRA